MPVTAPRPKLAIQSRALRSIALDQPEAIILAAGRGSRLGASTEARPKCLVRVGGVPLIEHQLRMLAMAGVTRVSVVVGYRAEEVRAAVAHRARTILNPQWEDTNSLYSFSLCHGHVRGPLLVLNCDVLVHPVALQRLLNARCSALLYDSSSGRDEEEMKVELDRGFLSAMSKILPHHRANGENVGILYFEEDALRSLFQEARLALSEGYRNGWLATAVERTARRRPVRGIDIADLPWIEIDFPDDLLRACDLTWRQLSGVMDPAMRLAS